MGQDGLVQFYWDKVWELWNQRNDPKILEEILNYIARIELHSDNPAIKAELKRTKLILNNEAQMNNLARSIFPATHVEEQNKLKVEEDLPTSKFQEEHPNIISPKDIDTSFQHIIGYEAVKDQLKTSYIDLLTHPEQARALKLQPLPSLSLYGPPGCGKTMFALACAKELSKSLIIIRPATELSHYFSVSVKKVQDRLDLADALGAVVFIDEAEQFLSRRTGEMGRILSTIMTWLEGVKKKNTDSLLITATNYFFKLDDAFLRRSDAFFIPPPDIAARAKLFDQALKGIPTESVDIQFLAKITEGFTGSDIAGPVGVVWKSKMVAFQRWKKSGEQLRVKMDDLITAIKSHTCVLPQWCYEARIAISREPSLKELFPQIVDFLEDYYQKKRNGSEN